MFRAQSLCQLAWGYSWGPRRIIRRLLCIDGWASRDIDTKERGWDGCEDWTQPIKTTYSCLCCPVI